MSCLPSSSMRASTFLSWESGPALLTESSVSTITSMALLPLWRDWIHPLRSHSLLAPMISLLLLLLSLSVDPLQSSLSKRRPIVVSSIPPLPLSLALAACPPPSPQVGSSVSVSISLTSPPSSVAATPPSKAPTMQPSYPSLMLSPVVLLRILASVSLWAIGGVSSSLVLSSSALRDTYETISSISFCSRGWLGRMKEVLTSLPQRTLRWGSSTPVQRPQVTLPLP